MKMKSHIAQTVFLAGAALLATGKSMAAGFYLTKKPGQISIVSNIRNN